MTSPRGSNRQGTGRSGREMGEKRKSWPGRPGRAGEGTQVSVSLGTGRGLEQEDEGKQRSPG